MQTNKTLFFEYALLPSGWAKKVRIEIDSFGTISAIQKEMIGSTGDPINATVLPGVSNLHCHAHQQAIAGLSEKSSNSNDNFWTWREIMYFYLQKIQPNHLNAIAEFLYMEMLKSGYTSVAEFQYIHHNEDGTSYSNPAEMSLATVSAAKRIGIGMTILPVLYRYSGFGSKPPSDKQQRFINNADKFIEIFNQLEMHTRADNNINIGIAPHSLRAIDNSLLKEVLNGIQKKDLITHIHISEQINEVKECQEWFSLRPIEWLFENHDINSNWCLIHGTHSNKKELALLAKSKAVLGACPTTEANLGDGIFNTLEYLKFGGTIGVGSDSNITVDPFDELRLLEYSQRLQHQKRNLLAVNPQYSTGRNLFELAITGGAQAIGRKTGRIEVGYRADFIVIDTNHPTLITKEKDAILDYLIFSKPCAVIKDVYVNGVHVIKSGKHPLETSVIKKYVQAINALTNRE